MKYYFLLFVGKLAISFCRFFNLGAGSTWPGHIVLSLYSSFIREFYKRFSGKIIVIAGTNGKTTTSKMIKVIAEVDGKKVIHNQSGANLLNGIASAIIDAQNGENADLAIFEVDENTLPLLLNELTPHILVILNLFRDQLDRYGEVDSIVLRWKKTLLKLPQNTHLILNADDPHMAFLGKGISAKVTYFGIDDKSLYLSSRPHAMDAIYCPCCGKRLVFEGIYFAHLGKWQCTACRFSRPSFDYLREKQVLPGVYNIYNSQAARLVVNILGISKKAQELGLEHFTPVFGRQEKFSINGKRIKIFLSKNPTGFNESIRTVRKLGGRNFLLVLNDRIPDGRDVSWIWDVDTEELVYEKMNVIVSGDRVYDIALRIKYSSSSEFQIEKDLKKAITISLEQLPKSETLYILPTYSAMLEVRKILTGRKIL